MTFLSNDKVYTRKKHNQGAAIPRMLELPTADESTRFGSRVSHGETPATKISILEVAGISRQSVNRFEKIAAMPEDKFEANNCPQCKVKFQQKAAKH